MRKYLVGRVLYTVNGYEVHHPLKVVECGSIAEAISSYRKLYFYNPFQVSVLCSSPVNFIDWELETDKVPADKIRDLLDKMNLLPKGSSLGLTLKDTVKLPLSSVNNNPVTVLIKTDLGVEEPAFEVIAEGDSLIIKKVEPKRVTPFVNMSLDIRCTCGSVITVPVSNKDSKVWGVCRCGNVILNPYKNE